MPPASSPRRRARLTGARRGRRGSSRASIGRISSPARRSRAYPPGDAAVASLDVAGIALTFIALGFLFRAFARPIDLTTLPSAYLFRRRALRGGLPGGLAAVATGATSPGYGHRACRLPPVGTDSAPDPDARHPLRPRREPLAGLHVGHRGWGLQRRRVAQNIESAEAAGDAYRTRSSLLVNGIGSVAAALFGSTFPTTIYIGHPGWKALGARAGYSVLNGAFVTIVCLTGTLAFAPR
jgi:AGZA family xanthine/uracil permease-like MFS transporter